MYPRVSFVLDESRERKDAWVRARAGWLLESMDRLAVRALWESGCGLSPGARHHAKEERKNSRRRFALSSLRSSRGLPAFLAFSPMRTGSRLLARLALAPRSRLVSGAVPAWGVRALRAGSAARSSRGHAADVMETHHMPHEGEVFLPSAEFVAESRLKSEAEYRRLYERSIRDPEGFWGEVASGFQFHKKVRAWIVGRDECVEYGRDVLVGEIARVDVQGTCSRGAREDPPTSSGRR